MVKVAGNLLGPMVLSHCCDLLLVLSTSIVVLVVIRCRGFLLFFHILNVTFNLRFEWVKRVRSRFGVIWGILINIHSWLGVRLFHVHLYLSNVVVQPRRWWLLQVDSQVLKSPPIKLLVEKLSADNVPVLSVSLVMRVLHQSIVFENGLPVFLIFLICWVLACELLNSDLMAVVVLEN